MLGIVALMEGALMAVPLILALAYGEDTSLAFVFSIGIAVAVGVPLFSVKPRVKAMRASGGLVSVALSWLMMSVIGAMPLLFSGKANFIDSLFEIVSGFTSTGSTVFSDIEALGYAVNMWRAQSQWIGGMGILLFVIALLPKTDGMASVFKAETPGPKAGKLVSKLSLTARILYLIYFVLTAVCTLLLVCGGVPLYESVVLSFATASTGGFAATTAGVATYSSLYVEIVITVFMFLFSVNFTLHYFVLFGRLRAVLKSEELRWFVSIILLAVAALTVSLSVRNVYDSVWTCLRYSVFETVSTISTTGFVLVDTSQWPAFSQGTLLLLMFVGGCAGSTGGGLKVSRIMTLLKSGFREVRTAADPRRVVNIKLEGRVADNATVHGVLRYFLVYAVVLVVSAMLIAVSNLAGPAEDVFAAGLTTTVSALNNIGPGLFGYASGNFGSLNAFSKCVLIFDMLAGRLEILPLLMLFNPRAWR